MELKEFKITVLPLRAKLLSYARKLTDAPEDAEDAVQEVLLKLWNKRLELNQYRSIEAFAMTLTHNTCIDMWRCKRNDNQSLDIVQAASPAGTPEQLLEIKDEICLMHEIINSLPHLQRTIMRMKDIEGYETDEIAEITGCRPEAIRSNLSRARKKVRDIYLQTIQGKRERRKEA
ncbi:RNA polymerase sigma factor [Bacteroides muris (ex Fokt et al. 2023)]|uniref:Sigma-70 family RNA polymerase sigma factor n=1 Tax=Bacteroides muris (ex Fokt et al. 2023) TaxID=2937417 RepID=A0A9X2NRC2_9BACE|nr:sigma-70 family RNA polymerase sigma factor [Bacteroides muris (ex Fokt et al. 2023)]MCR6503799.1 sigma-70 family RNA polymerase sigma factor [Bacteroides muris (ex Fokt et al. 2023)]